MLATDAWVFLDIRNPLCAWNVYRGVLVAPPTNSSGFVSVWTAALLKRAKDGDNAPLAREAALERVRAAQFPERTSRFKGMYCFTDPRSAEDALSWGTGRNHFRPEYVAELSLAEAGLVRESLDANWLTYSARDASGFFTDTSWIPEYWRGVPMPDRSPIWETVLDGRLVVLGTDLRERAYELLKTKFPDSLLLLETSRIAAWVGSNLGNSCGWLHQAESPSEVALDYLMDMQDANNLPVLSKMKQLIAEGHPVRWNDVRTQIERGNLGATPDLRPLSFRLPKSLFNESGARSLSSWLATIQYTTGIAGCR